MHVKIENKNEKCKKGNIILRKQKIQKVVLIFKTNKESYSLSNNVTINNLIDNGYVSFYNESYSHNTTFNELRKIKSYCNSESIICVGTSSYNAGVLSLVSCGNCFQILTDTPINSSTLINGAYWYMTSNYSFGFSSSQKIIQRYADIYDCVLNKNNKYDCNDNKRLSWHLTGNTGGWRSGIISSLNSSPDYKKLIFLKDLIQNEISLATKKYNLISIPLSSNSSTSFGQKKNDSYFFVQKKCFFKLNMAGFEPASSCSEQHCAIYYPTKNFLNLSLNIQA